jgi:hypothetical protein
MWDILKEDFQVVNVESRLFHRMNETRMCDIHIVKGELGSLQVVLPNKSNMFVLRHSLLCKNNKT